MTVVLVYAVTQLSSQVCSLLAAFGTVNRNYLALYAIPQILRQKQKLTVFVPKLDPSCSVPILLFVTYLLVL